MEPDRNAASPTESAHRELSSGTLWSRIVERACLDSRQVLVGYYVYMR